MARKKLTRRYLLRNMGFFVIVVAVCEITLSVLVFLNAYQRAESALFARAKSSADILTEYMTDFSMDFATGSREYVEQFPEKELLELQILDYGGRAVLSTTGFSPAANTAPDFLSWQKNPDRDYGLFRGKNALGESVMALCVPVYGSNGLCGAVRCVVSLVGINRQTVALIGAMVTVGIVLILLMLFTNLAFIRSIVVPVREINSAARRVALGDYRSRLPKKSDDELGELCDTINYMIGEIANSEQMKNEFITSISHEIRTPLTAIKGWGETLVQMGDADPELTAKGLQAIAGETDRLSSIVEELLDFSRMQSGQMALRIQKTDVQAELEEAVVLFRERARREGVELNYVETDDLPLVMGDRDRLRQVFVNILDNAIKYSRQNGHVRVEAGVLGRHVQIVFSDDGIGISEENLPKVRQKFFRVSNARPGSGIGLALVDEIIRRHGGTMDIESRLNKGTTVTVTLPIHGASEAAHDRKD